MTYGANFVFKGTGAYSPHGMSMPSGSHLGNKAYNRAMGGGISNSIMVNVRNNSFCSGGVSSYNSYGCGTNLFGDSGCCGSGIDDKAAAWGLGLGVGFGVLTSPIGGAIIKGIGNGFKYMGKGLAWCGKGIGKAASWTWNTLLKPAGQSIGKGIGKAASWTWNNVLKPAGQGIGNFFSNCWSWVTGNGWGANKAE